MLGSKSLRYPVTVANTYQYFFDFLALKGITFLHCQASIMGSYKRIRMYDYVHMIIYIYIYIHRCMYIRWSLLINCNRH